jgi:hypothetical protein
MRRLGASAVALVTLVFVADAAAGWRQPVGGANPINRSSAQPGTGASMAVLGGVPYVAWAEPDGANSEIRVARLSVDGTDWTEPWFDLRTFPARTPNATDGTVLHNADEDGSRPSLAVIGGNLWVAWLETDSTVPASKDVRVARIDQGLQFQLLVEPSVDANDVDGGVNFSQNEDASDVHLASVGGVAYVTWLETDGSNLEVRVARFNEATDTWDHVSDASNPGTDGGVNLDPSRNALAPWIADVGGVPHVAWTEFDANNTQVRVARLTGNAWQEIVGGPDPINHDADRNVFAPRLTAFDGRPYVGWLEQDATNAEVRVALVNDAGTAWEEPWGSATHGAINRSPTKNAEIGSLVTIDSRLYVAWQEEGNGLSETRPRVARLRPDRTGWDEVVGGAAPINDDPAADAGLPDQSAVGTVPWVAWTEGTPRAVRVARLEPEFSSLTASASTDGATLGASVTTFGVRFPVGFQYGTANENETATQLTALDANTAEISSAVSGLTPATSYSFRAFATAGVASPRVFSGSAPFQTAALPPTGGDPPTGSNPPPAGGGAPPPPGPGGPGAGPDTRAAAFSNLSLSRTSFRAASSGASVAGRSRRRTPIGTRVSYALDEAATVTFTVEKTSPGRRVRGKCVKATRSNRRRPRCTRITAVRGSFTQPGKVGGNRLTFRGRVGGRKLGAGSYRLSARAVDAAGNASPVARVNFKIVRR